MAAPSRVVSTVLKSSVGTAGEPASRAEVRRVVEGVIADVRERGDAAVREYSQRFDKWAPERFRLGEAQIDEIVSGVDAQILDDIRFVQEQVRTMAQQQLESLTDVRDRDLPGRPAGAEEHSRLGGRAPTSRAGVTRCSPRRT